MENWKLGQINKACIYFMPMLGGKLTNYQNKANFATSRFINCFIGDDVRGVDNKILLLYKFSGDKKFIDYEENFIKKHPMFEMMYEPDKTHTMYMFKIPPEKQKNYDLLLDGKYSKVSQEYKNIIMDFHFLKEDSAPMQVLHRAEERYRMIEQDMLGERIGFIDREDDSIELSTKILDERVKNYYQEEYKVKEVLINEEYEEESDV